MADLKFPYDMEDSTLKILLEMWGISPRSVAREAKKVGKNLEEKSKEINFYYFTKDYHDRENMMYAVNHLVNARVKQITAIFVVLPIVGVISVFIALAGNFVPLIACLFASIIFVLAARNVLRSYRDYFNKYIWPNGYSPFNDDFVFEHVCSMIAKKYNVDIWFSHF